MGRGRRGCSDVCFWKLAMHSAKVSEERGLAVLSDARVDRHDGSTGAEMGLLCVITHSPISSSHAYAAPGALPSRESGCCCSCSPGRWPFAAALRLSAKTKS